MQASASQRGLDPETRAFYCEAVDALTASGVPFLVGGAYAFSRYTGIERHTKDFDIFVRPSDARRVLQVFAEAGYTTELTYPHWLGKAYRGNDFVDVIFSSGNGVARVDDAWFSHARDGEILGKQVKVCPPEEMLWSKAFVLERERCDEADVMHLLRACASDLDWPRLLARFGPHWELLLTYLTLFAFVYPSDRAMIPSTVLDDLLQRKRQELREPAPTTRICQGTLISREQYLVDVHDWGYADARDIAGGPMTQQDVADWTAAIEH